MWGEYIPFYINFVRVERIIKVGVAGITISTVNTLTAILLADLKNEFCIWSMYAISVVIIQTKLEYESLIITPRKQWVHQIDYEKMPHSTFGLHAFGHYRVSSHAHIAIGMNDMVHERLNLSWSSSYSM